MTTNEVKAFYEFLIDDDNVSDDNFLVVVQVALKKLLIERDWEFLKTNDDSGSTAVGTKSYTLPTDFWRPITLEIGDLRYKGINRSDRRVFKDSSNRYYLDLKNSKYILLSDPVAVEVIYWDYIYEPSDVALDDTDIETTIPGFKSAFHPLLAYIAAKQFFYQDLGSKGEAWNNEQQVEYNSLMGVMIEDDNALKNVAQDSAIPDIVYDTAQSNVIQPCE